MNKAIVAHLWNEYQRALKMDEPEWHTSLWKTWEYDVDQRTQVAEGYDQYDAINYFFTGKSFIHFISEYVQLS